jgi:hypothetical protein
MIGSNKRNTIIQNTQPIEHQAYATQKHEKQRVNNQVLPPNDDRDQRQVQRITMNTQQLQP